MTPPPVSLSATPTAWPAAHRSPAPPRLRRFLSATRISALSPFPVSLAILRTKSGDTARTRLGVPGFGVGGRTATGRGGLPAVLAIAVRPVPGWAAALDHLLAQLTRWAGQVVDHPGRAVAVGLAVAAAGAAIVVARAGLGVLVGGWRQARLDRDAYLVEVTPPPEADPAGGRVLWAHLQGLHRAAPARWLTGDPHVVFEYAFAARAACLRLWVPGTVPPGLIAHAVAAAWPGATTHTRRHPQPALSADVPIVGCRMRLARPEAYPLRTEFDAVDAARSLLEAGGATREHEQVLVQIAARPAPPGRAWRLRRSATARAANGDLAGGLSPARPVTDGLARLAGGLVRGVLNLVDPSSSGTGRAGGTGRMGPGVDAWRGPEVSALVEKASQPLWETDVRFAVAIDPRGRDPRSVVPRLRGRAHQIAATFAIYSGPNRWRRARLRRPLRVLGGRRLGRGCLLSVPEIAALAHLPTDATVAGVERAGARPAPPPTRVPAGGRGTLRLGTAQVGGRAVALPVADGRYHLHVPGKTGTGKSTFLAGLVLDDVEAGRGAVVIDPGGDLVRDILDRLPQTAADRLVLLDPDQPRPPRLNPLAGRDWDVLVDNLVAIFANIFARHWGPRTDDVLRSACLTLMRRAYPTLEHVPVLLTDKQFRSEIVAEIDDPAGLGGFWAWYDMLSAPLRSQVIGPVLARLRAFLLRDFARTVVGLYRPGVSGPPINMDQILDGGLLLCRFPKGQLGSDTTRLLGSFVVSQVWQAATRRAIRPEHQRPDAALYVDECHNFLNLPGAMEDMLAEARKDRLRLVLAHQHLLQLSRELVAALSANARNKIVFTVGPEDARSLARHTTPDLSEHDLAHLGEYTAAARLVIDGRETPAFTLRTRPLPREAGHAAYLRQACTRRAAAQDAAAPGQEAAS